MIKTILVGYEEIETYLNKPWYTFLSNYKDSFIFKYTVKEEKNINKEIVKKELLYSQDSFEFLLAERFLFAHIDNQTPSIIYKLKNKTESVVIQEFSSDIEKIKRIDWYSEKEIKFIFDFIINDSKNQNPWKKFYWLDQIQTPSKLRQKNKEWVPYFVALIEPAKKNYICNSSIWTPTVT